MVVLGLDSTDLNLADQLALLPEMLLVLLNIVRY